MKKKFTEEDFVFFKEECRWWIDFFGIKDWYVVFDREKIEGEAGDCVASWKHDVIGRIVVITLNDKEWDTSGREGELLKLVAFHEVSEILLTALIDMAKSKFSENEVEKEVHSVVRRLENSIYAIISQNKR